MTPSPRDLLTSCLVAATEIEPWEQWVFLFMQGFLRDEPGDREAALEVLNREWSGCDPDPEPAARRAVTALGAASVLLEPASVPDPRDEIARRLLVNHRRILREGEERFQDLLAEEWERVEAPSEHVDWSFGLLPALPSEWPPAPDGRLYHYAVARGRDRRHPDAWHDAPIWARIETVRTDRENPKLVRSLSVLTEQKLPGIIIPRRSPYEVLARDLGRAMWETFEEILASQTLPDERAPETRHLREYYRPLLEGAAPGEVRSRHESFEDWLRT